MVSLACNGRVKSKLVQYDQEADKSRSKSKSNNNNNNEQCTS